MQLQPVKRAPPGILPLPSTHTTSHPLAPHPRPPVHDITNVWHMHWISQHSARFRVWPCMHADRGRWAGGRSVGRRRRQESHKGFPEGSNLITTLASPPHHTPTHTLSTTPTRAKLMKKRMKPSMRMSSLRSATRTAAVATALHPPPKGLRSQGATVAGFNQTNHPASPSSRLTGPPTHRPT